MGRNTIGASASMSIQTYHMCDPRPAAAKRRALVGVRLPAKACFPPAEYAEGMERYAAGPAKRGTRLRRNGRSAVQFAHVQAL